jgi:hypothetical protein
MRKMGVVVAVMCAVCLVIPFKGGGASFGMAQTTQLLTLQEAISAARRNAKPGSSFTVLREIVANADTRRVGDQALAEAQAQHIKLYKGGILTAFLRSGGFLLAETEPTTSSVIAFHLVSLGSDGIPHDTSSACDGVVKLADAQEVVKDTAAFTEVLYSTRPSEAASLASRFYGGSFPECDPSTEECVFFAVPPSLLKLGGDQVEYREVVALYGGFNLWGFRYALSIPTFAASPLAATQAALKKWEALKAEFLRNNRMDPHFDFNPENIRSKKQLRNRIDVLRRLDKFLEEALVEKEVNPAVLKANLSVATIPFGVGAYTPMKDGRVLYGSGTASLLVIYWQRLPTGGFAVKSVSEADAD